MQSPHNKIDAAFVAICQEGSHVTGRKKGHKSIHHHDE